MGCAKWFINYIFLHMCWIFVYLRVDVLLCRALRKKNGTDYKLVTVSKPRPYTHLSVTDSAK